MGDFASDAIVTQRCGWPDGEIDQISVSERIVQKGRQLRPRKEDFYTIIRCGMLYVERRRWSGGRASIW